MDIQTSVELTEIDEQELASILGCDKAELADTLSGYARAALREYVEMFLGQRVFSRGSDIREYRLLLLAEHAFGNRIPDEAKVCQLFQTTAAGSRALIRSTMSKYQYQLQKAVEGSVREILAGAVQAGGGGNWGVTVNNANIVELLNQTLARLDGTQRPVRRQKDSVSTYEIAPASYTLLCDEFNVER